MLPSSLEVSSLLRQSHCSMKDTQTHGIFYSVCLSTLVFQPVSCSSYSDTFWILSLAMASKSLVKIVSELTKQHSGFFCFIGHTSHFEPLPHFIPLAPEHSLLWMGIWLSGQWPLYCRPHICVLGIWDLAFMSGHQGLFCQNSKSCLFLFSSFLSPLFLLSLIPKNNMSYTYSWRY